MNKRRLPAIVAVYAVSAITLFIQSVSAIVIRHDRNDTSHVALAKGYPQAVSFEPDGTGTLIASQWVLTAAHVAKGISSRKPRAEINGTLHELDRIYIHPGWNDMGGHDLALIRLSNPETGIEPAKLYRSSDEAGTEIVFVGRGDFGNGLTGPTDRDRILRAATNIVDRVDDLWLYFTFDQGDEATELEGVSGPGDSGGPALFRRNDTTFVLGVSVFGSGPSGPGHYGVTEGYTRVSTHTGWIDSVVTGLTSDTGFAPGSKLAKKSGGQGIVIGGTATLPDTPEGRLVQEFLDAYNTTDIDSCWTFISENYSPNYFSSQSEEEHRARFTRLHKQHFGTLKLINVREMSSDKAVILLRGSTGKLGELRFEFKSGKINDLIAAIVEVD